MNVTYKIVFLSGFEKNAFILRIVYFQGSNEICDVGMLWRLYAAVHGRSLKY